MDPMVAWETKEGEEWPRVLRVSTVTPTLVAGRRFFIIITLGLAP